MRWIIAYDVRDDRQRRRMASRLEQVGFRRQKSVFEGELGVEKVRRLLDELSAYLDARHDSLTAWPTAENGACVVLHRGRALEQTRRDWLIL